MSFNTKKAWKNSLNISTWKWLVLSLKLFIFGSYQFSEYSSEEWLYVVPGLQIIV